MKFLIKRLLKTIHKPHIKDIYHSFAVRSERYWLGVLAIAVIITRWFGQMRYLASADSVRYALALDKYDVALHQPHPPGYALYILVTKPIYWLIGDANTALIIVSIIFSVLSIYAVFYLAKRIYGQRVAWISVLLLASIPTIWFHGQVALNYITDLFFAALFGIYAYDSLKSSKDIKSLLKASLILGIGGGFRPTLVIFMLPLWLWIVLRRKNVKVFFQNAGIIALVTIAWLLPIIALSGGIVDFWNATYSLLFDQSAIWSFSALVRWNQLWEHFKAIMGELWFSFGLAIIPVLLLFISLAVSKLEPVKINYRNLIFWALWLIPSLLFYLLILFTVYGYLLVLMPALIVLVAKALDEIIRVVGLSLFPSRKRVLLVINLTVISIMFIVGFNIFTYFKPDASPQPQKTNYHTIASLHELWDILIPVMRQEFNPQSTIIGIDKSFLSWGIQHFQYYLPEYVAYQKIEWGTYNPDDMKWYMVHNRQSQLVATLDITLTDSALIVIRDRWYPPAGSGLKEVSFAEYGLNGRIVYYDLTDPDARKLVRKVKDIQFVGEKVDQISEDN